MTDVLKALAGISPAVTGVIGVLAGYAFKWFSDEASDRRLSRRERQARREARRDQLLQRRNEFQRESLIALQLAIARFVRAAGKMSHHDEMEFKRTGEWGKSLYPQEDDDAFHVGIVETMLHASRIRDPAIRDLTQRLREQTHDGLNAASESAMFSILMQAMQTQQELNSRIGQVLMNLEDEAMAEAERN